MRPSLPTESKDQIGGRPHGRIETVRAADDKCEIRNPAVAPVRKPRGQSRAGQILAALIEGYQPRTARDRRRVC